MSRTKLRDVEDRQIVIDALYECDGMVYYAAQKLFVSRNCLHEYIERNDLYSELKKARDQHKDTMVDIGLFGSKELAQKLTEEPSVALKACLDALNRYGKERGVALTGSESENETLKAKIAFYEKIFQNSIGAPELPKA